nr:hypothetical protein [Chloroflexota bacterium]
IDGQGGSDTIDYTNGPDGAYTTSVSVDLSLGLVEGVNGGVLGNIIGSAINLENVIGGDGDDILLGDTGDNIISGGRGTDILVGLEGDDRYLFGSNFGIDTVKEGLYLDNSPCVDCGIDTLDFSLVTSEFSVNFALNGTDSEITERDNEVLYDSAHIENYVGGAGADTFDFADGVTMPGIIDGHDGLDTLDYADYLVARDVYLTGLGEVNGFDGTETSITGGFKNIDAITASGAPDDKLTGLTGLNSDADWHLKDAAQYQSTNTLDFSNFEILVGGEAADTFTVTGTQTYHALRGGSGDDIFRFNDGSNLALASVNNLTGYLDGQGGIDELDYQNLNKSILVDLPAGVASLISSESPGNVGSFLNIENAQGGQADDRFVSDANNNTFTGNDGNDQYDFFDNWGTDEIFDIAGDLDWINFSAAIQNLEFALGSVVVTNGANELTHQGNNIEKLTGGQGNDNFIFTADGVKLALGNGQIDGHTGTDTLDYSEYFGPVTVDLSNNQATGTAFVSNIENLIGGSGSDSLTGDDGENTFIGNAGADDLDGGGGVDTVDYSDATVLVIVDLAAGTASGGGGDDRLSNIENVIATDFNDEIASDNSNNQLVGGKGDDTYFFKDDWGSDRIIDIDGEDTIDYTPASEGVTFDLAASLITDTGDITDYSGSVIETLVGSGGDDTFNLTAAHTYALRGGLGKDTFAFSGTANLNGTIDGQDGDDALDYSGYASGIQISLDGFGTPDGFDGTDTSIATGTPLTTGGFSNIDMLIGTSADDQLFSMDLFSTWTLDGDDSQVKIGTNDLGFKDIDIIYAGTEIDTFNILGNTAVDLYAGAGADIFSFANSAVLDGLIDGQSGADVLKFEGYDTGRNIILIGVDATNGFSGTEDSIKGGFSKIFTLVGSTHEDQLTGLDSGAWQINGALNTYTSSAVLTFSAIEVLIGGSGVDTFTMADGAQLEGGTGKIDGAGGTDEINYAAYNTPVSVDLAQGTATGLAAVAGISNIENVTGGNAADDLTCDGSVNILAGGPGDDVYHFGDGFGLDMIIELADAGLDTIDFAAATLGLIFTVNIGALTVTQGADNKVTHLGDNLENLFGSDLDDDFELLNDAEISGIIDGRDGFDTLDFSDYTTSRHVKLTGKGSVDGFSGTEDSIAVGTPLTTDGFDNINHYIGGKDVDRLTGLGSGGAWLIDGVIPANKYHSDEHVISFFDVEELNSGGGENTFTIVGAVSGDLTGTDGDDIFIFEDGATLDGNLNGVGGGYDVLDYSRYQTVRHIELTGFGSVDGFAGTEDSISGEFDNINKLLGSTYIGDSLTGRDAAIAELNASADWEIDTQPDASGTDAYTSDGRTLDFDDFEVLIGGDIADTFYLAVGQTRDLRGGAGNDTLVLANGATLDGAFDGQTGADTIDWSANTSQRLVTLQAAGQVGDGFDGTEVSIAGGFSNVDDLIGIESVVTDRLYGPDLATEWQIGAPNQIVVDTNSATFTNFDLLYGGDAADHFLINGTSNAVTLLGGPAADTFTFNDGATLVGSIDGQGGSGNTLDYSAYETGVKVNMHSNSVLDPKSGQDLLPFSATGTTGVFNIQNLIGGHCGDTLIGTSGDNTITGGPGDDYLEGRSGIDIYKFADGWSRTDVDATGDIIVELEIWDEIDVIDFGAATVDLTVTFGSVLAIDAAGNKVTYADNGIEKIITGSGSDTFMFSADGMAFSNGNGIIDGGEGVDLINYSKYTTGVVVNLFAGTATGISAISNVEDVLGGTGNDIFTSSNADNVLTGGLGSDTYIFMDDFGTDTVEENLAEGLLDTMEFSAATRDLTFTLSSVVVEDTAGNSVTHTGDFIERLVGGQGDDSFRFAVDGVGFADDAGMIDGGGGTSNTLDYSAFATTAVNVNLAVGAATGTGGIANIQNVIGGKLANEIWGDDNANILTSGSTNDNLHGLGGDDTYVFHDGWQNDFVFEEVNGGNDTLSFANVGTGLTFNFGFDALGTPQVVVSGGTNSMTATGGHVENFVGAGKDDLFVFADGASVGGLIDGLGGHDKGDTLDYSAYTTARDVLLTDLGSVGFQGREASGNFDNIDNLIGTALADSLTGRNAPAEFVLEAADQYISVNTLDLTSFENFTGGTDADTFRLLDNHIGDLSGGLGDDRFVFTGTAVLTGLINGGQDIDELDFSTYAARQIKLTDVVTLDGFRGMDQSIIPALSNGFTNINTLVGSAGVTGDTLTGADLPATWSFNADDTYTVNGNSLNYVGFENLFGGSDVDTFSFKGGATYDGLLDGGLDTDRFDFSAYDSAVTLNLDTNAIPGVLAQPYVSIEGMTGSTFADTLIGPDAGAQFNMTSLGAGNVDNNFDFSAIEKLSGGLGDDALNYDSYASAVTLDLENDTATGLDSFTGIKNITGSPFGDTIQARVTGSTFQMSGVGAGLVDGLNFASFENIQGDVGVDALDYSAYGTAVSVNLRTGASAGLSSFAGIEDLIGSPDSDLLIGPDAANTFAITGLNIGTVAGWNYTSFENLTGGSAADSFSFLGGALSGSIVGGLGVDQLDYRVHGAAVEVDLLNHTATGVGGTVTDVEDILGTPFDDILTGSDVANRIDAVGGSDLITGHAGDDQFIFPDGATFRVLLDGGQGTDAADFSAQPGAITVLITGLGTNDGFAGSIDTKDFDNLDILIASDTAGDSLTGRPAHASWNLDADYQYVSGGRTFEYSNFETLTGGTDVDVFNFVGSVVFDGDISGGDGADTLDYSAYNGSAAANLQTQIATGISGTFADFEALVGSGSSDTIVGTNAGDDIQITASNTGIFNGYTFMSFESIDGGAGDDQLSFAAMGTIRDVTLQAHHASDGFNGDESSLAGGFANIDHLIGTNLVGDILRGLDEIATWVVDGIDNQYQVNPSLGFAGFELLVGGNAVDTFDLTGDLSDLILQGQGGNDQFEFADGTTLRSQAPAIDGGSGDADALDYSDFTTTQVDVDIVTGRAMNINDNTGNGFSGIEEVVGGQNNVLYGDEGDNILVGGPGVNILVGRGGNDTYLFADDWGTAVVIENPGEGSDTIDLSGVTESLKLIFNGEIFNAFTGVDPLNPQANTLAHAGSNGISQVENFVGGQNADTFDIIGISNEVNLRGGPGADRFTFADGATLNGTIAGEGSADTLDHSAYNSPVTVDLSLGSAFNVSNNAADSLSTVENLIGGTNNDQLSGNGEVNIIDGGPGNDKLAGGQNNDTYVFKGIWGEDIVEEDALPGSGLDTMNFSAIDTDLTFLLGSVVVSDGQGNTVTHDDDNIEILLGGGGNDTFTFSANGVKLAGGSGTIDGGAGVNTLDFAAYTDAVAVNLDEGTATGTSGISNIHNVIGGSGADVFTGDTTDNTFTGNAGDDIYIFLDSWGTDTVLEVDAGGDDVMDFSVLTTALNVTLGSVTVTSGVNTATHNGDFIENMVGGKARDTFTINGNQNIDLYGGAGADSFIFADDAVLVGEIDGQADEDTLNLVAYSTALSVTLTAAGGTFDGDGNVTRSASGTSLVTGGFRNIDILIGGTDTDELIGVDLISTWTIDNVNNRVVSGANDLAFSSIETVTGGSENDTFYISSNPTIDLYGGAGADSFIFANNAALDGQIDGQDDEDTLNLSAYDNGLGVTLTATGGTDGFDGTITRITDGTPLVNDGFDNFDILVGSSASDELTGADLVNTWTIDGSDNKVLSGTNDLAFSSIETVTGGTDTDTFNISNNPTVDLRGGAGADSFVFADNAALDGLIDGQADDDTLNLAAYSSARVVTLDATGSTDGFRGTVTNLAGDTPLVTGGFDNIDDLIGTSGDDVLNGLVNANAKWAVKGIDNSQYTSGNDLTFKAFEEMVGGNSDDTLTFAAFDTAREITLDDVGANGFDITEINFDGIFKNIDILIGSTADNDIFNGLDAVSNWQINGLTNTYNSTHNLTFSALETLRGGSKVDTFVVADGVTFTGSLDGLGGADELTFADFSSSRSVLLISASSGGFSGTEDSLTPASGDGFFNIDTIVGSPEADDSLTGANLPATWDIDGTNQYIVNPSLNFSGFENLTGGSDKDTFVFQEGVSVTGDVDGGDDFDTLDYGAFGTNAPVMVDLSAGTAENIGGDVSHIENVIGGDGDDQITGDDGSNVITGGPGLDTLAGGLGDDRYMFGDGWGADTINEDSDVNTGNDTLDFSAVSFNLSVDIADAIAISGDGNTADHNGNNIEVIIGGSKDDTFNITGARPVSLDGSAGADTFIFNEASSLTNNAFIDGGIVIDISGIEIDVLDYSANSVASFWVLTGLGTVDGFKGTEASIPGNFDNINKILGKERVKGDTRTDALTGFGVDAIWNINDVGLQYTAGGRTLDFANLETLIGGSKDDTFVFDENAQMPGVEHNSIDGKSGSDTLDYSAYNGDVVVDLQKGIATGIKDGIGSIENVVGSLRRSNTIYGDDGDNRLESGVTDDIFYGYGGNDTYVFNTDTALGIDTIYEDEANAGSGTDTFDFSGTSSNFDVTVDLANQGSGAAQIVNNNLSLIIYGDIENIIGGSGDDNLSGTDAANVITGGPGDDTLSGKAGDDQYLFADGWGQDTLNDSDGTDTLDFSAVSPAIADPIDPADPANLTFVLDTTEVSISDPDGTNTVTHFGSAFEYFIAGGGNDRFDIMDGVSVGGYVDGQGGDNVLDLSDQFVARNVLLTGFGDQSGFDGVDAAIPNGFQNISIIFATSNSTDRLAGLNEISSWELDFQNVGDTNTYTAGGRTLQFTDFERLTGGAAADTFTLTGNQTHTIWAGAGDDALVFNDGAELTGTFDGQSDHDTVDMSAYETARQANIVTIGGIDGFNGTISGITGIYTNTNALLGSVNSADDIINGGDFDAFWDVDGAPSGNQYSAIENLELTGNETDYGAKKAVVQGRTVRIINESPVTLDFAGFETLQGNDQNDIFEFAGAQTHSVLGGADVDYFVFNDGASLTGTIDGQGELDTLDYNAGSGGSYSTALAFVLTGMTASNGSVGTASNITGGFTNIAEIVGGAAVDSLAGLDADSTWSVEDHPTFGQYTSTHSLNFALVDTLIGSSGIDIFDFADGATLAGEVEGGAENDKLDFGDYSDALSFVLDDTGTDGFDGTVTGVVAGFTDINIITGGSDIDSLAGRDQAGHWAINGANSGVYTSGNELAFTQVDTLIGNTAADRFDFADGASLSGLIDGGGDVDLLDYADYNAAVTVNLFTRLATGVNGNNINGVSNIENITGGSAGDSLTGDTGPNEITGNGGNDTLAGLGGDDTFIFDEGWGNDTLNEGDSVDNDTVDFSSLGVDLDITLSSVFVTDNPGGTCGVNANCLTHT